MVTRNASKLSKSELGILESYWTDRKEIEKEARLSKGDTPRAQHLKQLVKAMDDVYKESDDGFKTLIQMHYKEREEFAEVADELEIKVSKVRSMNRILLNRLAEKLGWIWY